MRTTPGPPPDLAAEASAARPLMQVAALVGWVGTGRKLTQTGRLTMADARQLVALLDTGDVIDPTIGDQVFRTKSSQELYRLTIVVAWAKAAGLVRVVQGRLVGVKKNAPLLHRPLDLWAAMFDVVDQLGGAVCPSGWFASLLGEDFADGVAILLAALAQRGGTIGAGDAHEMVWTGLVARYRTEDLTAEQRRHWRQVTDRDLGYMTSLMVEFGALTKNSAPAADEAHTLRLTPLAESVLQGRFGTVAPCGPVAQIKITLLDTAPPVWRRLLVPTTIRLDRLHQVIQAAMGWDDYHMHMFIHRTDRYGTPDPELQLRDERQTGLHQLATRVGDKVGYEYDFGDGWEHEILLEKLLTAEPDDRYPRCVAGARACPPEDCGGTPGYQDLIEILNDPDHPEHQDMRDWLGLAEGIGFDPARFDPDDANRRIETTMRTGRRTR